MRKLQQILACDEAIASQISRYQKTCSEIDARIAAGTPHHGDAEEHDRLQAHISRLMDWRTQTRSAMHAYMLGARPVQDIVA